MILSFTAIDKHVELRSFWCQLTELEVALDVLSTIASQGDTILNAHIIDEGGRTELPPEAFDGQPCAASIRQLEKQWQGILNEPVRCKSVRSATPVDNWHVELTHQRIKLYEVRIIQLTLMITKFEHFRQRVEDRILDENQKAKLINSYDVSLSTYRQYVDRAKVGQQEAQQKLIQLQG